MYRIIQGAKVAKCDQSGDLGIIIDGKIHPIVSEVPPQVQADLSQNDPAQPDYVKNKTHSVEETILAEGSSVVCDIDARRGYADSCVLEAVRGIKKFTLSRLKLTEFCFPAAGKSVTYTVGRYGDDDVILTFTRDKRKPIVTVTSNMAECVLTYKDVEVTTLDEGYIPTEHLSYRFAINVNNAENDTYGRYEVVRPSVTYADIWQAYMEKRRVYCTCNLGVYTSNSGGAWYIMLLPLTETDTHLIDADEPFYFSGLVPSSSSASVYFVVVKVTKDNVWTFDMRKIYDDASVDDGSAKTTLYVNGSYLYHDEGFTSKVSAAELDSMMPGGVVINYEGCTYFPVNYAYDPDFGSCLQYMGYDLQKEAFTSEYVQEG